MLRRSTVTLALSLVVLAGCGDDGEGGATTTGAAPSNTGASTVTSDAPGDPGGTKGGTVTIDGTTYAFVASLQCGIYASVGQYYISGTLPDVDGGDLAYSRDEGVHELRVDLGDVRYFTLTDDDIESTISGNVVTGSAHLTPDTAGDPVDAEFRFEC